MADTEPAEVMEAMRGVLEELSPELAEQEVDVDADLFSAGYLDARSACELVAYVEETYDVDVDEGRLESDLGTLRLLAEWVSNHAADE